MYHTLILSETGKVYSWGLNDYGQLGCPKEQKVVATPLPIEPLSSTVVVRVVCGMFHSAAITMSGQVETWGNNLFGQLGHG